MTALLDMVLKALGVFSKSTEIYHSATSSLTQMCLTFGDCCKIVMWVNLISSAL